MLLFLYRLLTSPLFLFMPILVWYRLLKGKELSMRWKERLGFATLPRPPGELLWLHAASVGEANSIIPLIRELHNMKPDCHFLITTITVTGNAVVSKQKLPNTVVQFLPMDIPLYISRFLRHWRPNFVAFVESEIWPNIIYHVHLREIPLILLNARMSERSFGKWSNYSGLIEKLIGYFQVVLPSTYVDQERYASLGATSLHYIGHLKYAVPPLDYTPQELESLKQQIAQRPVFLCSSIHAAEVDFCVKLHQKLRIKHPELLTIIAPRHPENGSNIQEAAGKEKIKCARRSAAQGITSSTGIYIADTIGELGLFYRLSPMAFIGGSLIEHGGQNMLEPARVGCFPIVGPHTSNFIEMMENMEYHHVVIRVPDFEQLIIQVDDLLSDPSRFKAMHRKCLEFANSQNEILHKTARAVLHYWDQSKTAIRKQPKFFNQYGLGNIALQPAAFIYRYISIFLFKIAEPYRVPIPVICIGNVVVGGGGKTPTVIAVAKMLIEWDKKVVILTRGYGGKASNSHTVVKVTPGDDARLVGDEALLLAEVAPTYVCANRALSAQAAYADGAQVIVMDDGMQNYTLDKDYTIMVVDAAEQFGNGLLLPAGPLREPIEQGIAKSNTILTIGKDRPTNVEDTSTWQYTKIKVENEEDIAGHRFLAICSIATPEKFFATIKACGAEAVETISFPDHHYYSDKELADIFSLAERLGVKVLTTSKDVVKFPESYRAKTQVLRISMELPPFLVYTVKKIIKRYQHHQRPLK